MPLAGAAACVLALAEFTSHRHLTLSAVEGAQEPPLDQRTLPEFFTNEILANHRARPALICSHELPRPHGGPLSRNLGVEGHLAWDFDEFDMNISALARGLVGLGVKKGDRVAIVMGNNSAYAMLQWACSIIGAISVTVNPAYRVNELIDTLRLVGVNHVFLVPQIRKSSYLSLLADALPSLRDASPGNIQEEQLPELKHIVAVDNLSDLKKFQEIQQNIKCVADFREVLIWGDDGRESRAVEEMTRSLHKDDIMNMQFTSGTTGSPKAVSLTHHNLLNNALSIGDAMRLTEHDVVWNLAAWAYGSCIVYPSEIFDPPSIVDALVQERCTALHGVPTHFYGVLAEVEHRQKVGSTLDLSRLRTGIAAGSPIPIGLMRKLIENLNLRDLTIAYGMSESLSDVRPTPVSFQTTIDDPIIKRVETVGKVRPHVKAKIIDEGGNVVPIGTPGELLVSGYLVQKGYWKDEEHTRAVIKRNPDDDETLWMHTGDEAVMDEQGYLRIISRIKDIVIRGGENLFPVQIENVLSAHPSIIEAAIVAVPDVKYGEVVGAWIVSKPDGNLSREAVRKIVGEKINPQNAPAWVWFIGESGTPDELPKTASGKVQKHILRSWSRDLAEKGIGLVQQ
ncbi:hypothetical protein HETIRDRAFT_436850 [Heterobasidion irregulare TC 32-1]|uniref:Uncharacterized protein n=1 Tax=Heterobasidion irregulare (strain TC 32-1) TaxID=747525 RepID=W4JS45_HETIT|nr:uncharacterized protein HETIRDRAFT_436850 [Heterobasidion irregulare TC 32-1]ETW75925.1 hypothetical protein HETIRDRAFT_436850 [Heterobasidion irregulare TC 32-1]